ncbi:MAG TPA: 3-hydroxyacyl-CoA dehydrogenase NAD-binding domain-containing protein [Candidatus Sulfotelmatobacter sp.]|nr:3-hydroxyacyl-CoA dehydrogenase NAD-binding domain-containing protein [Candidatus Sulfotelmatobacter sp.]HWI62263.1 3-hydroxyacyl-CoA dehydrogenase NAD-binding domain-containing protein [Symbiobacteriaceae bacterium]
MKAGIIGGGMIGAGWARLLRAFGHEVRIYDEDPACREVASIAAAVAGADVIFEAVAERLEIKRAVFSAVEAAAPTGALIASASSSLLPSVLQEGLRRPERVLVIHPLHPVDLLPVIEVVPGAATAPEAVEQARLLIESLGKRAIVLQKEVPGYVVNRLAAALWREAIDLVLAGVVDVQQLDLAASRGPCLGWAVQGPFLTYQLAAEGGLGPFMAHLAPAFSAIWSSLARWDELPAGALTGLVAQVDQAYGTEDRGALEAQRDRLLGQMIDLLQPTELT